MALALHDVVEATLVDDSGVRVRVVGEGADRVATGQRHLVARATLAALSACGVSTRGLDLHCCNAIPHSRGLGSSAAAVVAGVVAGYALAGRDLDEDALQLAAEFEGHADNAAASLYGGLVVAWREQERFRAVRIEPHPALAPVALIPDAESATATTRGLLPHQVPHADAAFAAGRAALAVHALTVRPDLLLAATDDRLHQKYREQAWPATYRLVGALREAGVPAAVSGAGPTVLALPPGGELPAGLDTPGFAVRPLAVDLRGAAVETLDALAPAAMPTSQPTSQ
jgi:homoserine kinase